MVNGLVQTATQSTFWVHIRLLEDVVLVPACWEALILGCDEPSTSFSSGQVQPVHVRFDFFDFIIIIIIIIIINLNFWNWNNVLGF